MPTRKISEPTNPWAQPAVVCRSLDHNPPMMMVYDNGTYEHTCSDCGKVTTFVINKPVFGSNIISGYSPIRW